MIRSSERLQSSTLMGLNEQISRAWVQHVSKAWKIEIKTDLIEVRRPKRLH